jgi:hypothetical protein
MKPMNVNGAILTGKAIEQLKRMQDEDNSLLRCNIRVLHQAVRHIIGDTAMSAASEINKNSRPVLILADALFCICDAFENLYAVENEPDF